MIKKIILLAAVLAVAAIVSGCGIPFSTSIPITITVPAVNGTEETLVSIPAEAQDPKIDFTSVTLNYAITKDTVTDDISLDIYGSTDQVDDNTKALGDETIISSSIPNGETTETGTNTSASILSALDNHQSSFIMGIRNFSTNQTGGITIELNVDVEGTYNIF